MINSITNVKLWYLESFEAIYLCINKYLIVNRIIRFRLQYLKQFNCVQTNELWQSV